MHSIEKKLAILSDAAKYDASCASSGTRKQDSLNGKGIGSRGGIGICHSYTPDGRCVSLLKILMTNYCMYDCLYCINRKSSNTPRARLKPNEIVELTINFYKRNYIEGLFLSSGIIRNPDYTMECVIEVAQKLREEHDFRGYIHLKTIPEASRELIAKAGQWADRLSINIELPKKSSLTKLAPEKDGLGIKASMQRIHEKESEYKAAKKSNHHSKVPHFAPAGQSTQMIVGADDSTDSNVLSTASQLYRSYGLRRVYYSAFSPIPDPSQKLPPSAPPLLREHRLYQADWLVRFYGFNVDEIVSKQNPNLNLKHDPKTSWALLNIDTFPVDLNTAPRETLLRVPGLGVRSINRILKIRKWHKLCLKDLSKLRISLKKVMPFICLLDYKPSTYSLDRLQNIRPETEQLQLFDPGLSPITGEL
ncbi:putative DNA modification/repair radical SAM protein [Rubellicoccus peritrichatus]|uniref:DNA modification/repair radical SAM protein n=1 Tax=Rubellicoccus peritrichatus TaxID=3080537 RepID=A0AAQ3LCW4_9BACT|nr:putative DNA modification/repair radical SAM protein [Puniceicoccus sp. CR14]WOO43476.1 putative DNA modification/repair radical SAM protein [Puniceicoccus sp. CR14]